MENKKLSEADQKRIDEVFKKAKQKELEFFKSWGFVGSPVIAAGLAYQSFLEKERRGKETGCNIMGSPIARRMFMIGYMLNGDK
jgi:hypothetical protein